MSSVNVGRDQSVELLVILVTGVQECDNDLNFADSATPELANPILAHF